MMCPAPRSGAQGGVENGADRDVVAAPEFNRDADILAAVATDAGLPTICEWGQMAARGCLLGYGPVATDLWRRAADYARAKPAKQLAVTIPTSVLLRADQLTE
jgi:hypothetical protein